MKNTLRHIVCILIVIIQSTISAQKIKVTHGPILGKISDQGIGIWVRTSAPGETYVKYGVKKEELNDSVPIFTTIEHDVTGWVRLSNLQSNTRYHYQVGEMVSSFKTLPKASDYVDSTYNKKGLFNFSFEFGSCNYRRPERVAKYDIPTYVTMNREIADKIDFAILNGDFIYEGGRGLPVKKWSEELRLKQNQLPEVVRLAPSIVGVWENYKMYMEDSKALLEWHSKVPSMFTMDDHEIIGDTYGTGEIGRVHRKPVFRDIATQAWVDYIGWSNPDPYDQKIVFGMATLQKGQDILVDKNTNFLKHDFDLAANLHVHWGGIDAGSRGDKYDDLKGDENAGVYEIVEILDKNRVRIKPHARASKKSAYSIGRQLYTKFSVSNADFYILDTRMNREMHDVTQPNKPGVSMLGDKQKEWLKKSMQESKADFHFVVSSVNLMIPHRGSLQKGIQKNKDDAWTVFLEEREELINFWDSLDAPVFVLTADLHNSFVSRITKGVWEFASSPHSSKNHLVSHEGNRAATGIQQFDVRSFEMRWSTFFLDDTDKEALWQPTYCVVQVNNVFNNPKEIGKDRWVAYPHPQVVFQYYSGNTGDLLYAEAISTIGFNTDKR